MKCKEVFCRLLNFRSLHAEDQSQGNIYICTNATTKRILPCLLWSLLEPRGDFRVAFCGRWGWSHPWDGRGASCPWFSNGTSKLREHLQLCSQSIKQCQLLLCTPVHPIKWDLCSQPIWISGRVFFSRSEDNDPWSLKIFNTAAQQPCQTCCQFEGLLADLSALSCCD